MDLSYGFINILVLFFSYIFCHVESSEHHSSLGTSIDSGITVLIQFRNASAFLYHFSMFFAHQYIWILLIFVLTKITYKFVLFTYQILRSENIEFVVAPYEADAQLAYLATLEAEKGGVAAVITEDSDLIAYGCPAVRTFAKL